jgi:hypothetical protein
MSALGYNPCEIHKSVLNRIFNEAMTIYFMVRQPTHQGVSCTVYIMWHKVLHPRSDLPSYLSMELWNIIIQWLTLNPSEWSTLEHIVGLLWLSQGEESSQRPSIETLPKHLDSILLACMSDRGYDSHMILECLFNRELNEAMATYLTLSRRHAREI